MKKFIGIVVSLMIFCSGFCGLSVTAQGAEITEHVEKITNQELSNITIIETTDEANDETESSVISDVTEPTEESQATKVTESTKVKETTKDTTPTKATKPTEKVTEPKEHKHKLKVTGSKKATYFAKGHTGKTICKKCKKVISKGKKIPKLKLKVPKMNYTTGFNKLNVKYKKTKDATGFQLVYKIKKQKIIKNIKTAKTITKTIKTPTFGTCKVKARAFIKKGKKIAYSKWTDIKILIVQEPKRVYIGVGHGGYVPGAVANGYKESNLNLAIALACRDELVRHDVNVKISRTTDIYKDLDVRVKECNAFDPVLALDVHNNAGGGDGAEIYYKSSGGVSKTVASNILAEIQKIGQNSRGIKTRLDYDGTDYYGFIRETDCPAIIVECAFIDNSSDIQILNTPEKQKAMGVAIAKGILKTIGIKYIPKN